MFTENNDLPTNDILIELTSDVSFPYQTNAGFSGTNSLTYIVSDSELIDEGSRLITDIDADEFGSSLDSIIRLFDFNGFELAVSDDTPAPGEFFSLDSFLEFTAEVAGDYFIGVSGFSNFFYSPFFEDSGSVFASTGDYTVTITVTPAPPINDITGTSNQDVLTGTEGRDLIFGLGGSDTIIALGGNDQIFGDNGADLIVAGDGNDTVDGGTGNDQISGGAGNDILNGGNGADVIFGEDNDSFTFGNDQISGGAGSDRLFGGLGDDQINGDAGNDIVDAGDGFDIVFGGLGSDRLFGGFDDDQLNGDAGNDQLNGDFGFDSLNGGDGNDTLYGGFDDDVLNGDAGRDTLEGGFGFDALNGGAGNDLLIGVNAQDLAGNTFGAFEVDILTGGEGRDTFVLGDADRIYYDDGDALSSGDFDYALITDFNPQQDRIQLKGSVELYSLDFFASGGISSAALIFDSDETRGETIAIIENVSRSSLNLNSRAFVFA